MRRGSLSSRGRGRSLTGCPYCIRGHRATVVGLRVARARPDNAAGVVVSFKGGCLPEKAGELARAGDRDDGSGFAAMVVHVPPALIEAVLRAPSDSDHARVLSGLAAGEVLADPWCMAVVVGGLDQEPPGVLRTGFGDRSLPSSGVGGALGRGDSQEAEEHRGTGEAPEVSDLGT